MYKLETLSSPFKCGNISAQDYKYGILLPYSTTNPNRFEDGSAFQPNGSPTTNACAKKEDIYETM
jgi:hypothetical protein